MARRRWAKCPGCRREKLTATGPTQGSARTPRVTLVRGKAAVTHCECRLSGAQRHDYDARSSPRGESLAPDERWAL